MKLIGKGAFTKCYMQDCGTKVLLISEDPIKECMAHGWFPESPHFPKVTLVDTNAYEMQYMMPVRSLKDSLDADNWQLYQVLRDCFSRAPLVTNKHGLYSAWYNIFEAARERNTNEVVVDGLGDVLEALDACSNYGSDIAFEISPRNVRVNEDGELILMDCFYLVGKLQEVRDAKRRH